MRNSEDIIKYSHEEYTVIYEKTHIIFIYEKNTASKLYATVFG